MWSDTGSGKHVVYNDDKVVPMSSKTVVTSTIRLRYDTTTIWLWGPTILWSQVRHDWHEATARLQQRIDMLIFLFRAVLLWITEQQADDVSWCVIKWSSQDCLILLLKVIECYHNERVLWDIHGSSFLNLEVKDDAWQRISAALNLPTGKSITLLCTSFR